MEVFNKGIQDQYGRQKPMIFTC